MAHYAKVLNNKVLNVIVAEEEFFDSFVDNSPGEWIQTSYNTRGGVHYNEDGTPSGKPALRKNFAGKGYTYNRELDAFIPPSPFPSWVLDEETCTWSSPVEYPTDGKMYKWNEQTISWEEWK